MKWQRVPVSKSLAVWALALLLLAGGAGYLMKPTRNLQPKEVEGAIQLGFYDLMSQRKEIYDCSLKTVNSTILTTITSPDDNRFVLKGKFTPVSTKNERTFFSYTPIYFSSVRKGQMVDGFVDLLLHRDVWLEPLSINGQPLVVGQSGMIFPYQLTR